MRNWLTAFADWNQAWIADLARQFSALITFVLMFVKVSGFEGKQEKNNSESERAV